MVRLAALLAALTLALAACSDGDPEPAPAPTPSASDSATASPSASDEPSPPPPMPPAAMNRRGPEGAKVFTIYFWQVVDYAQRTLDIDSLRRLTSEQCDGCRGALDFLQGVIDHNGTISGGNGSVSIVNAEPLVAGTREAVSVTFDLTSTRQVLDAPGRQNDQVFPAATVRNRFVVEQRAGGWRVALWEVLG